MSKCTYLRSMNKKEKNTKILFRSKVLKRLLIPTNRTEILLSHLHSLLKYFVILGKTKLKKYDAKTKTLY